MRNFHRVPTIQVSRIRFLVLLLVTFCLSSSTLFAQRLLITPAAVTIVEGESGDFTVMLSSEPTSDVTVTIVRSDGMNVSLDRTVLTFTPSNWNQGQTVTMMAEEDMDFADNTGRLILIASGGGYTGGGVTVSPEAVLIESIAETVQLEAMVQDQDGTPVTGVPLEWSSADTSVAVVDSTGKVTGVSNGSTEITATLATASAAATILVEDSSLILSDRKILEMFYRVTGGDEWGNDMGWLTDAPLDQWHGVETDEDSRVTTLSLQENGLKGTIPAELGELTHLEMLNLWGNKQLTGPLPPRIGNLERLRELDLGFADLEGEIPSTLGKLVKLRIMNLESVPFSGSIPPELGALAELDFLNLYRNRLSGRVPAELAGLRSLRTLYLDENELTGSIPATFVQLEKLETFNWQDNDGLCAPGTTAFETWRSAEIRTFTGPRCNESDLTVLKSFYESADGANWTYSTGWLGDTAVEEWYGVNADSLGQVTSLDLSNNRLRGQLSSVLGSLDQLSVLRVNGNPLSGRIPSLLTKLALEEFRYANTDLCVPAAIAFQQWINSISIHEGTGIQCPALSEREILSELYEATGGVNWRQRGGWLTNAPLAGWYGVTLDSGGRVIELALPGNNLRGRMPLELEEMTALRLLDLSFNWLEGVIAPGLGRIKTLTELYLESNLLSGPIPAELGTLPLRALFLYDNRLEGPIPPELGNLSNLKNLRISENRLSGRIPPELGNLSAVQAIWLDENQLEGEIPPELGNLSSVQHLYVGYNNLSGSIPPELGNLQSIIALTFDGNNLTGPIPPELGKLESLSSELNLRENSLSGEIPAELGNLNRLTNLRLGDNKLTGLIPPEISRMHALEWLDLSDNPGLTGPLPSALADLVNLRRFEWRGTDLCIAPDSPLADPVVARRFRLPSCDPPPERSTAYLIQSIQSARYPVSLVAGKDALLRVFPISTQSTSASIPPVRATLFVNGAEVHTADIPGQSTPVPTELAFAEESLDRSANIQVPGSVVQPGLEMVIEIDPDGTLDAGLEMVRRIPESGRTPVGVEVMPTFELTMVPFVWQTRPDYTAEQLVEEMMQNPGGHRLLSETRTLLPVDDISVTAHPSVLTSSNDSDALLDEVGIIRIIENGAGYWMGALSGEATGSWGVAWIGGWTSYVRLGIVDQSEEALTVAHELGHNTSLYHAPCGTRSVLDPGYPYPDAEIGTWGIDSRSGSDVLVPPSWSDMMSYCVPAWISEYNFDIAMNHRLDREASGKRVAASTPALLVWGGADEEGKPYLNPVFAVDAPPSLPDGGGDHQITGRTADGDVLFWVAFDMKPVADTEGRSGFAFAIPSSREWTDVLAEIELSGPGGSAIIDENSNRPALILREQTSGRVRALLRGESAALIGLDAAAAGSLVQETDVEILFSLGLPQLAQR